MRQGAVKPLARVVQEPRLAERKQRFASTQHARF